MMSLTDLLHSQAFQSGNYLRLSVFICLTSAVDLSIKNLGKRSNVYDSM